MSTSGIRAGRAFVELGINDQLSAGLKNAQAKMRAFSSGIQAVGATIGGIGLSIAGTLAWPVTLAANMEQTEAAFTTLLKDAAAAKQLLGEIQQFAASTPFQFPELAKASQMLIAFGSSADEVVDELRRIGDVASGINQPIGEIAEIYGKARTQGRLFGEDINQLAGRGIPIIAELAKQFGVSENEVKNLVSSGEVGFANLEQAFADLTSGAGMFAGGMDRASKTFLGRLSTLMDNFQAALRPAGEAIMKQLGPVIDLATVAAQALGKFIEANSGVAAALAGTAAGMLVVGGAMFGLGLAARVVSATLGSAIAVIKSVQGAVALMQVAFTAAKAAVLVANAVMMASQGTLAGVTAGVILMNSAMALSPVFVGLLTAAYSVAGAIVTGISAAMSAAIGFLAAPTTLVTALTGGLSAAWTAVAGAAQFAWASILWPLAGIVAQLAFFAALIAGVTVLFGVAASKAGLFATAWSGVKGVFSDLWSVAKDTFGGITAAMMSGQYATAAAILWAGIKAAFWTGMVAVKDGVAYFFSNFLSGAVAFGKSLLKTLWSVFTSIPKMIWSAITGGPSLAELLSKAFAGGVGSSFDSLERRAKGAREEIKRLNSEMASKTANDDAEKKSAEKAEQLADSLSDRILSLKDQGVSAVHGKDYAEEKQFQRDGADYSQIMALRAAQAEAARAEAIGKVNDSVRDQIHSLNEQAYAAKHGAEAGERYKLSLMGATGAQLEALKMAQDQAAAAAKLADMKSEATSLAEAMRSPFEVFRAELERSQQLLRAGLVDETTFRRNKDKLQKGFLEANDTKEERQATFREQQRTIGERLNSGQINEAQAGAQIAAVAQLLDQARLAAANAGTEMDKQTKTAGTFDGFAIGRAGAGRDTLAKETAEATKATAENTRKMADRAGKGNPIRFGA